MLVPSALLASLGELVTEAGGLAQQIRSAGIAREIKKDGSLVTPADKQVEIFLRSKLPQLVPGSNVWGEEFGIEPEGENGLWLVDPVDGTTNFAFGGPLWGVSVALVKGDRLLLAAIALPDLGELHLAQENGGAFLNGVPLPKIPEGPIQPYEIVSYDERIVIEANGNRLPGKMRCSGAFVIDGTFTTTQRFRGLIGLNERLYDVAACVLMAQELGGDVRYADGSPFDIEELKAGSGISKPWLIFPANSGFSM